MSFEIDEILQSSSRKSNYDILKSATGFLLKFHVSNFIRNFLSFSALQRILIRFDKVNKPLLSKIVTYLHCLQKLAKM